MDKFGLKKQRDLMGELWQSLYNKLSDTCSKCKRKETCHRDLFPYYHPFPDDEKSCMNRIEL